MIAPPEPAIWMDRVSHWFGKRLAVDDVSLTISKGQVTALVGLNGAGKTTSMRIMMGLLDPTRGSCRTLGDDSHAISPSTLSKIGYLVEGHYLPSWMRVQDLERFSEPLRATWNHQQFRGILDHFGITSEQKIGELSRGQRAGVSIASVLAGSPELLVLDDPSLGLDPVSRRALNETLLEFVSSGDPTGNPRTILLSTHQIDDVERIADHIVVMIRGQLWVDMPLADFQDRILRFAIAEGEGSDSRSLATRIQSELPGVIEVRNTSSQLLVSVLEQTNSEAEPSLRTRLEEIVQQPVEPIPSTLEDRVISYLSRERDERFVSQTNTTKEV